MIMTRADQPVESADDLDPVTVDLSADNDNEGPETEDAPIPTVDPASGSEPATVRAPNGQFQPRQPGDQRRPSKDFRRTVLEGQQTLTQRLETLMQTVQQQQNLIQQLTAMRDQAPAGGNGKNGAQNGQNGGGSPVDQQITGIRKEQQEIMDIVRAGGLSAEQANALSSRYQSLEDQRQELRVQKLLEERLAKQPQGQEGPQLDPATAHAQGVLTVEFPEVMNHPEARTEARNYHAYLVSQGRADGIGLLREAAAHVARRRGLGAPRTSPATAAAFSGAGPNQAQAEEPGTVTFTPEMLRQIRGAGVTPQQIAAQMLRERSGR